MAMHSPSGNPHGPWIGPTLIYLPSNDSWYAKLGINNPTLLITANGTSFLAGRTCVGRTEHPWIASAPHWTGPYASIDNNSQPYAQTNAEDQFMWQVVPHAALLTSVLIFVHIYSELGQEGALSYA